MSQAATETTTGPPPGKADNFFTRKIGPLPAWGWIGIAALAAGGYLWYRNRQGANAAAQAAATTPADTTGGADTGAELSTIQTELQDLAGEESQEGSSKGGSSSGDGSKPKYTRHVSTGKESLTQIAKAANTSVAHIVSVSKAGPEDKANLDKLLAWAAKPGSRRKGVVYYTSSK